MRFLTTDGAPKAIGPYSQAVIEDGFLFASGQVPLDPASGKLRRFGNHRPARSTVIVAALPAGAALEIDLIARVAG